MFKSGDTVYFIFRGNFVTGRYKDFYCLPTSGFSYFPFMPIQIIKGSYSSCLDTLKTCTVKLSGGGSWIMPIELLEKEFSFNKFVLAKLAWGGSVSQAQFKTIMDTL